MVPNKKIVNIAFVGKYTGLQDSYLSVIKSLKHSSIHLKVKINLLWIEASDLEPVAPLAPVSEGGEATPVGGADSADKKKYEEHLEKHNTAWALLKSAGDDLLSLSLSPLSTHQLSDGILVPGGFGNRGVEGKIAAAKYARTHRVPYLGLCLGMQVMVIEYARHVVQLSQANSSEFDESTPHPVILFMPEINQKVMGGTMRLGSRPTSVYSSYPVPASGTGLTVQTPSAERTLASDVYGTTLKYRNSGSQAGGETHHPIHERHRHRYEVNPLYVDRIQTAGLFFSGVDDKLERMEIAELPRETHPFFFGTQFHPEFKSRPNRPSPPVYAFIAVAAGLPHQLGYAGEMWQHHEVTNEEKREMEVVSLDALPPTPFRAFASQKISSPQATRAKQVTEGGGGGREEVLPLGVTPLEKKRSIRALSS
jgi:CTP synthase